MPDVKIFADDTSLFPIVNYLKPSALVLNNDLLKIQYWAYHWKMSFNQDRAKQVQEVIFLRKTNNTNPSLYFNNVFVNLTRTRKQLGLQLDSKLSFCEHTNNKISKAAKAIGLLLKLQPILPRKNLLTIYKSFIRPHLDYVDVTYDQPSNASYQALCRLFYC